MTILKLSKINCSCRKPCTWYVIVICNVIKLKLQKFTFGGKTKIQTSKRLLLWSYSCTSFFVLDRILIIRKFVILAPKILVQNSSRISPFAVLCRSRNYEKIRRSRGPCDQFSSSHADFGWTSQDRRATKVRSSRGLRFPVFP